MVYQNHKMKNIDSVEKVDGHRDPPGSLGERDEVCVQWVPKRKTHADSKIGTQCFFFYITQFN
jgi:hypothetical protein